jgi:hypothetical protein
MFKPVLQLRFCTVGLLNGFVFFRANMPEAEAGKNGYTKKTLTSQVAPDAALPARSAA